MTKTKEIKDLILKNADNKKLSDYEIEILKEYASGNSDSMIGMLSEIATEVSGISYAEDKQLAYDKAELSLKHYLTVFENRLRRNQKLINLKSVDLNCCPDYKSGKTVLELLCECSINPVLYAKAIRLGALVTPNVEKNFAKTADEKRTYMNPVTAHKQINKVYELFLNSNVILNKWIESGKKLTPHEIKVGASRLPKSVQQALFEALKTLRQR